VPDDLRVYGGAYADDEEFQRIRKEVDEFAQEEGRRRASSSPSSARTATTAAPR
jgi:hypothetical protein